MGGWEQHAGTDQGIHRESRALSLASRSRNDGRDARARLHVREIVLLPRIYYSAGVGDTQEIYAQSFRAAMLPRTRDTLGIMRPSTRPEATVRRIIPHSFRACWGRHTKKGLILGSWPHVWGFVLLQTCSSISLHCLPKATAWFA